MENKESHEFQSHTCFHDFAHSVRHKRRYILENNDRLFLDTVLATLKSRDVTISENTTLFRAQLGVENFDKDGNELEERPSGFGPKRMKPLANYAKEGRVNPAGISALYLATTLQTAISEVRPWIGSEVSVAQFKVLRKLRAVNLSLGHGRSHLDFLSVEQILGAEPVNADEREKSVWRDIDNAFSRPVTLSDGAADYVPTQILAELFRDAGYDAIVYRSQFGQNGYNVALFNIDDAEAVAGEPYRVTTIDVGYDVIGRTWALNRNDDTEID